MSEAAQGTREAEGPITPLSPFRVPTFRALWAANLVSNLGAMIQSIGAAWLMASISQSPALVALVQASVTLPIMLLSLPAGALADSIDRRLMMIAAQSFMFVASLALAIFAVAGELTPWLLLALTFLVGCGQAANTPPWQASVGDLVPRRELSAAVALNSMGFNIARSVGPAIGGAIVAIAGAATAFVVNTITYVGLIAVLARWRSPPRDTLPRESLAGAMSGGLRYVAMSPSILRVLVRAGHFGFAVCSVNALLPLVARDLLQAGPLSFGFLLGAFGVGSICGALVGVELRRRWPTELIVQAASLAWTAGAIGVALSRSLPLSMLALVFCGVAFIVALSTFNVTVQLSSPRWVVARMLSLYQMSAFGGMALGSWLWGAVATHWTITISLLAASALMVAGVLVGLRFALPNVESLNLDPLRRWSEPQVALPTQPNSGPIVITIEYVIAEEDTHAFLAAMTERRRTRLRNGALGWTLSRDMGDPEHWIERYHTPTWLDYVRFNTRTTHADAEIVDKVRALHRGPEPPVVRRMIERRTGVAREATPLPPDPH